MIAVVRPDSWDLPLLVHVGGAMLLVGTLVVAAAAFGGAWRQGEPAASSALSRLGFRTITFGVIPSFLLMRIGAELIASKEDVDDNAAWIGVGYIVSDLGLLLLIVMTILGAVAFRRIRARSGGSGAARAVTMLSALLILGYLVAVWAMATKPT